MVKKFDPKIHNVPGTRVKLSSIGSSKYSHQPKGEAFGIILTSRQAGFKSEPGWYPVGWGEDGSVGKNTYEAEDLVVIEEDIKDEGAFELVDFSKAEQQTLLDNLILKKKLNKSLYSHLLNNHKNLIPKTSSVQVKYLGFNKNSAWLCNATSKRVLTRSYAVRIGLLKETKSSKKIEFKKDHIYIAETRAEARMLLDEAHKQGYEWSSGRSFSEEKMNWHPSGTYYDIHWGVSGDLDYLSSNSKETRTKVYVKQLFNLNTNTNAVCRQTEGHGSSGTRGLGFNRQKIQVASASRLAGSRFSNRRSRAKAKSRSLSYKRLQFDQGR